MTVAAKNTADAARRAQLAKIHLAKKRLGPTDELYHAIIARVSKGKASSGDLSQEERGRLLDEFKQLGFLEGGSFTKSLDDFTDREPQARLIRALWADCAVFGIISDSSEPALRKFIKRTTSRDALEWLDAVGRQQGDRGFEGDESARRLSSKFDRSGPLKMYSKVDQLSFEARRHVLELLIEYDGRHALQLGI